jgi:hypothetical protein
MSHRVLGIVDDKGAFQPRCMVVWIELQDSGKVAPGPCTLSGPGSLHAPLHEDRDLPARGVSRRIIRRQAADSF